VRIRNRTVAKDEWRDPADTNPNRRVARVVRGWRSRNEVRRLAGRNADITQEHVLAADMLCVVADGALIGFTAQRDMLMPVHIGVYRPSTGPTHSARRQAQCDERFRQAWQLFDRQQRDLLAHVVLGFWPVSRWCRERGQCAVTAAMRVLVTALDRLVGFFGNEIRRYTETATATLSVTA
jgi:hypothetical protein